MENERDQVQFRGVQKLHSDDRMMLLFYIYETCFGDIFTDSLIDRSINWLRKPIIKPTLSSEKPNAIMNKDLEIWSKKVNE